MYNIYLHFDFQFAANGIGSNEAECNVSVKVSTKSTAHKIKGGGLDGEFTFAQFHFHWGKTNSEGSEHEYNDFSYPIEVSIGLLLFGR